MVAAGSTPPRAAGRERSRLRLAALAALGFSASCGGAGEPGAEPPSGEAEVLVPGTPPGGLEEWVRDMEAGLADVPELAAEDPAAAADRVRKLYIGRLEYVELYWGADRPLYAGPELETAVEAAESRFHELIQLLGEPEPGRDRVDREVLEATASLRELLVRARDSGARLSPREAGSTPPPRAPGRP